MYKKSTLFSWVKGDRIIWSVVLFLSLVSIVIVYSATGKLAFKVRGGDTAFFLIKQSIFLLIGIGIMLFQIRYVPLSIYSRFSPIVLISGIALLFISILFVGENNESTGRTLGIGGITFQPAEMIKLSLVMYTARILSITYSSIRQREKAFWIVLIITVLVCGILFLVNFSNAVIVFVTIMGMLFIARLPIRYLILTLVNALAMVLLIVLIAHFSPVEIGRMQTIKGRIERFISRESPNDSKRLEQKDYAQLAIYKGGIWGKGPGESTVSNFMAASHNDFIFAIFIEEYGLIGAMFLMLLYFIFFFRTGSIITHSEKQFPAFLTAGLALMVMLQVMINMGVAVNILPVTGQPLPWVSLGGTSTLFTAIAFGCILSVSAQES